MSNPIVLQCEDLSQSFFDGDSKIDIFSGINFSVVRGEMVSIMGASGAGKSTLLHLLGGLDSPASGCVSVQGQRLDLLSEKKKCLLRNQHLGFVYQFHHLLPEFNALENVCMPLLIRGVSSRRAKTHAEQYLQRVGLAGRMTHRIGELSGGERQRVAIARALVTQPSCVLADEPTGNLDSQTANEVFDMMLELNKDLQTSFVVVTHNPSLSQQLDRQYVLQDGNLHLIGNGT